MKRAPLRFRQVHLDFHTAELIPEVGARFDKKAWQKTLQDASVNSITCFSKCHQGWSYHPTKIGKMHPGLNFDLLRSQYDACKEIGINIPIYISAGFDDVAVAAHPDWRDITPTGPFGPKALEPGYKLVDFHSPYLDYLCAQIEEVVRLFPDCDGIFLDIICQLGGVGPWSLKYMESQGLDPQRDEDRQVSRQRALDNYYERTTAAAKNVRADIPVFHNSGHITRGNYSVLRHQTHLELESLPTGGWGYDHFPESAKYVSNLGLDFMGQTGKFHTTWGEFGGYKHPDALRYECASMIALGARCSVGDQLHPCGMLDASTYEMIGGAFREVAAKEPWCLDAIQVADVGLLSSESEHYSEASQSGADTGAARIFLEEHILFSIIDRQMDFSRFRLLVLPDDIFVDDALVAKINVYLAQGGKLLLTGKSGLRKDGKGFAFDIGAEWKGESNFSPDYILAEPDFRPTFVKSPLVMYLPSQRICVKEGRSIGKIHDPYFNRTYRHYFSQHAPPRPEPSGFDAGVIHGNIVYLAHPVFSIYRGYGAVATKEYIAAILREIFPLRTVSLDSFPSTARVTFTRQEAQRRWVLHVLSANTIARGGQMYLPGGNVTTTASIEVIEELLALPETKISIRIPAPIRSVTLEPGAIPVSFKSKDGVIEFLLPSFSCHQMVVLSE